MHRWGWTLAFVAACTTRRECEARIDDAIALGEDHGVACTLDVAALAEPTCGGTDRRPELSYYAAFCDVADIDACIDAAPELRELCFGDPTP